MFALAICFLLFPFLIQLQLLVFFGQPEEKLAAHRFF
jgi:hypothetical protein